MLAPLEGGNLCDLMMFSEGARQIPPSNIILLYQIHLPFPFVFLQTLLATDCLFDTVEDFVIDEQLHPISFCETRYHSLTVFPGASRKVVGDANIKRSISLACQDVDVIGLRHRPGVTWVARIRGP